MRSPSSAAEEPGRLREFRDVATRIRLRATRMVAVQGFGYLGQALSSAEEFAVLFRGHFRTGVDRFVLSPAHYAISVYAIAVELGVLSEGDLARYGTDGSPLEAVATEQAPFVDLTCGSLGQGLSGAVGLALADRLRGSDARVFALLSDGEMEEGQVWEAAMFAGHHRLDRLVVLLDCNDSQVDGPVSTITTVEPVRDRWAAFGWAAREVDGHDVSAVDEAIADAIRSALPAVVVCRTSTRTGLDCLPPDADGHFIKLPPELAARATEELEVRLGAATGA
jgi:transketolase